MGQPKVISYDDFALKQGDTKFKEAIRLLIRLSNRHKFNYDQLRYIFGEVRKKCEIKPKREKVRLFVLPTSEEKRRFFAGISNPIHRLIFETLLGTGLRVSELCCLKVTHIDFERNFIHVHAGKGDKDRMTVLGKGLAEKLLIYLNGKTNLYLFESRRNTKYTSRRIQQLCSRYSSNLKCKITPHTFRHVWNTRLAESGLSREHREILAGHSKGSKTQDIYTHLGIDGVKDKVLEILDGDGNG